MAYTSVIPVRRLDRTVDYVQNKEKTTPKSLEEAVDYAANRDKTESACFETGLGCTTTSAFEDMRLNTLRWHKETGVQGYHLVQSFAEGEVTPELAHQIGVEFAEQLLHGKYQAIVTTHLNTKHLAANFTDEVAAQINGILHDIQTGESTKPNLQEQLEQTQQEFDRLLEMSLDFDENTPFLDDKLKKLNNKIKSLKKAIEDSAARQEKARQPEMLLSAKDLQIQEYDDALTARIIEKITVRSRNEIEIRFIGGYKKTMQLT